MINSIRKNAVLMMLALGLVFTTVVPGAMAQDRCRTRNRQVSASNYYDGYQDRNDRYRDNRRYDDRDYRYDDRYNDGHNGRAVKRVGIGAAAGAVGGGLIGGRKGVVIGGLIGAAGG